MSHERDYMNGCAKNGEQKIYFSPRWSRPVAPRHVSWILPAYARAIFLKKTFIIGLSLSLAFYPVAPAFVVADDTAPAEEPVAESAEPEPEEEPAEEEAVPEEESEMVAEPAAAVDKSPVPEEISELSQESPCEEDESGDEDGGSTIKSCNEAEAETDVEAASDTGENSVMNEEPEETESATIEPTDIPDGSGSAIGTGDAGATAISVNDVNTNIVGADVEKEVVIKDGSDDEDIDLLGTFVAGDEEPVDIEAASDGGSGGLTIENGNVATVENAVTAGAETGNNTIEGGGDAAIGTGDASALAAAINIVNTTLVGSNGLFAIVNIVGDYAGDVIVPGEGLLSFDDGNTGNLETVENGNEATIENTVVATADTGGNAIEDSGTATIETGDATASAASETVANTNFVGDNWLIVVINVFGEWLGGVVDSEDADGDGVMGYFFGGGEDGEGCEAECGDIVSVSGKNVAYIKNAVTATADTGGNTITGADDATIATGNASATAAAFNFVNNNIVGSNWLLGIVNVFGSWGGDLVFAYPDLATSVSDGREAALPGDTLEYEVRVENGGKADAENVKVLFRVPDASEFRSAGDGAHRDGDTVSWIIDDLKKGESMGFSVKVSIGGDASDGEELLAYAQAETGTAEKHQENNGSEDETRIDIPDARITSIDADDDPYHTGLRVRRSKPEGAYRGGEAITHWITVENTGKHDAYEVVVSDAFNSPDGTTIATPLWLVGDIESGKGVRVEYTIVIPDQVGAGQYRYIAKAEGRQRDDEEIRSKKAYAILSVAGSAFASSFGAETVEAAAPEDLSIPGEVRGAEVVDIADIVERKEFPLWMLLLSGVAYALMLNWSFFPSGNRRDL
ncbi:MAG: DUF11 domain-containing protein [Candidatus Moranbacteria bacterium]|nr:DUF11 domain-containing protein [Candidatus Moranbacteria bacterium]